MSAGFVCEEALGDGGEVVGVALDDAEVRGLRGGEDGG